MSYVAIISEKIVIVRILIHIGSPKTGTSSIQHALSSHRSDLLKDGYLYPSMGNKADHGLLSLYARPDYPPRSFTQSGKKPDLKKLTMQGNEAARCIEEQVKSSSPHTLILSSEYFFENRKAADGGLRFVNWVRSLSDEVDVICYLRDPVDYVLSHLAQTLKGTHVLPRQLTAPAYVSSLAAFGDTSRMHIRRYDRDALVGGDVVTDFWRTFIVSSFAIEPSDDRNLSLSAEGIDIYWTYRRLLHADRHGKFTTDCNTLFEALLSVDQAIPGRTRLTARPEIARRIRRDFQAQADQIHDRYHLRFAPELTTDLDEDIPTGPIAAPHDVYVIDAERRDRMIVELLRRSVQ